MAWNDWVDIDTLRYIARHTITAIAAIVGWSAVQFVLTHLVQDPAIRSLIELSEKWVVVGILWNLAWKVFTELLDESHRGK